MQIDGETVETVIEFVFLGSKIAADGDCSHEMKRLMLLGRKAMTNLEGNGNLPGSSPGGSREFKAGTASARIRKQLLN